MTDIKATLKTFEEEFGTLPSDVQQAIIDLIAEIKEVGLGHIGGFTWRGSQNHFELARPILQIISPSIVGEVNEKGTFCVTWTTNDFILPDLDILEEAFSPLAHGETGQLCRSSYGDDCPSYAGDDCPSSAY